MARRPGSTVWVLAAAGLASCASPPGEAPTSGESGRAAVAEREPATPRVVPPPPGVDSRSVTPQSGTAWQRAETPLEEVLNKLPQPPHLRAADRPDTTGEPPLAAQKLFASGRQALRQNDNFRAVQQFEQALRLAPGRPAILRSLGEAWTRAGNRVSAANFYRRAAAADPADLDSVVLLGRFALDARQWESAAAHFAAALRRLDAPEADDPTDPAARPLARFLLAQALNQAGYSRAAAAVFDEHFREDPRPTAASSAARQLAAFRAQRGETMVLLGDLRHRLDEPAAALRWYSAAAAQGVLNRDPLRRRLIYTRLRLGQTDAAERQVLEALREPGGGGDLVELVAYAVRHGVSAETLAEDLADLYEQRGRPASLALAMADALPRPQAADLLRRHLDAAPTDDAVRSRLVALLVAPPASRDDLREAVGRTVEASMGRPAEARGFAAELRDAAGGSGPLLDAVGPPKEPGTLTLTGRLHAVEGRTDAAVEAYESALALDPDAVGPRVELASLRLDAGDLDAAETLLAPLAGSDAILVVSLRVRTLREAGRAAEALALLDETLADASPASRLMLDKADLLLGLDRVTEAEQTLLDALNARPTDEAIYARLLKIYDGRGDMTRNYQRLVRRMFDTIPDARLTRIVKAETLVAMRRFAAARDVLDTLGADDGGGDPQLELLRVEVAIGLNRADEVDALIDRHLAGAAAGRHPADDEALNRAARFFARAGNQARAIEIETARWEARPPDVQRARTLAGLYLLRKRPEDAAAVLREQAEAGVPAEDVVPFHAQWIAALFELGRSVEAVAVIENAVERYPAAGADLTMMLAFRLEAAGDTAAARRAMAAGLERYPDDPSLNNSLGYGLANEGVRLDEAKAMIARAVAAEPGVAAYLDSMGWVYYKLADFETALNWLERGRRAEGGTHPVIIDHQGDTLYRLGRAAEAVRVWNEARLILMQPGYQPADPEEEGLAERLEAKITAVAEGREPAVADVGQDVDIPAKPRPAAGDADIP
ncbi:MAG: tetratricopeptide repeat protein [Planctomycetota bacterium]